MSEIEEDSTDISRGSLEENRPRKEIYQKKKKARYKYQGIPASLKYEKPSAVYQICGDIFLSQYNDSFVSELSFINEFKLVSNINITQMFDQIVLSIELVDRKDVLKESMDNLFAYLQASNDPNLLAWREMIKRYTSIYSKVILKQSRKKSKSDLRRKFYAKVMEGTFSQTEALFRSFPCIQSKYRVKNHKAQLTEIVITESFINELGYDLEDFIDLVLHEGFPRIMNYDNTENSHCLKMMIENYFKIEEQGLNICSLQGQLRMNDKYVKNVIYQNQMLMNYEARTFGFDIILALSHKGEPYIDDKNADLNKLNRKFIQMMAEREKERNKFLSNFYGIGPTIDWASYDKTCLFKEMSGFDDTGEDIWINKKEEES